MQRIAFIMRLRPERVHEYLKAHEHVWAEMLVALRAAGWSNYSLFILEREGLVVGYVETLNFSTATSEMALSEINTKWQERMAEYFTDGPPDQSMEILKQYFYLA
jgi:L-rhamnose mutarotase